MSTVPVGRGAFLAGLLGAALVLCAGCPAKRPPAVRPSGPGAWQPMKTLHVRGQLEPLGEVPNSGLQLPAVSPDGRWVACLRIAEDRQVDPDALLAGRGLGCVSLAVRAVGRDAAERVVCPSGACWPAWSADGSRLCFVVCDPSDRCELGIYDPATGLTRRVAVGLKRMTMPALSPSGGRLAVVEPGAEPGRSRLFACDLETLKLVPHPRPDAAGMVLRPQWISERELLYLEGPPGRACRWHPGASGGRVVCSLYLPAEAGDAFQVLAGVQRPLSPDGRHFACYDAARDRIVLVDLAGGRTAALAPRTRAGCWFGGGHFVAATDDELLLASADGREDKRLIRGRWLPVWAGRREQKDQVLLLTEGSDAFHFRLVRLHVIFAK